ncbi:MAG: hypothetical protein WA897_04855, partial [Moheibacter sp.]
DSRIKKVIKKHVKICDSTTINLLKDILEGVGRNPKTGKKKEASKFIRWSMPMKSFLNWCGSAKPKNMITSFWTNYSAMKTQFMFSIKDIMTTRLLSISQSKKQVL